MNRGSTLGCDHLRRRTHASMRPRFMNRGSPEADEAVPLEAALQ